MGLSSSSSLLPVVSNSTQYLDIPRNDTVIVLSSFADPKQQTIPNAYEYTLQSFSYVENFLYGIFDMLFLDCGNQDKVTCAPLTQPNIREGYLQCSPSLYPDNCIPKKLPTSHAKFCQLQELDVTICGVKSAVISELARLQISSFERNNVESLPDLLSNFKNQKVLNVLFLRRNTMNGVPDSPGVLWLLDISEVTTCNLDALEGLMLSGYSVRSIPDSVAQSKTLEFLDVATRGLSQHKVLSNSTSLRYENLNKNMLFPSMFEQLRHMIPSVVVNLSSNGILLLGEEVVERWCTYPNIMKDKRFLNITCDLQILKEPPFAIFEQGPEACYEYYCSMKLTSKQSCSFVNVQVLGEMGSGKTSLIRTMKNDQPSLVDSEEAVYSIGTVKLLTGDALMQFYDYASDDIYELAYHMFIRSTKQIVILAVNLPEYSEAAHDRMVTRWLTGICTSSTECTLMVACTQADLCTDEEIKRKRMLIKSEINSWLDAEHQFMKRISRTSNVMPMIRMKFFMTSSKNMNGIKKLVKCLVKRAKEERVVVPKHWRNMYTSFYKICDDGQVVPVPNTQSKTTQFFRLEEAFVTFMNSLSQLTKLFSPNITKDFHQCLQFFNNIGMLLWYEDDKQLQDMVFHNVSFLISALQLLFQQNIQAELKFDPDNLETPGQRETDFNADVATFVETGLLTDNLLQNIWKPMKLNTATRKALKHLLINLELCYIDNSPKVDIVSSSLRFPWFVSRDDEEGRIERKWPDAIPALNIQFSLAYNFYHRVPPAIYKRFCVRIQKHLIPHGHTRHDFRNTVYIVQDDIEVLILKDAQVSVDRDTKPSVQKDVQRSVQIHFRCPAEHLLKLQPLMSALYQDFEELCAELPTGLVLDGYLLCPHCLLKNAKYPTRRPTKTMTLHSSIETVICDDDKIPAALVYPILLASDKKDDHLTKIEEYSNKMNSLVSEDLLLGLSKRITEAMDLRLLGFELGIKYYTVNSILHDYRNEINEAAYQLLSHWRWEGIKQRKNGIEMEKTLLTALCSKDVGMNIVAAELKHDFEKIRDTE